MDPRLRGDDIEEREDDIEERGNDARWRKEAFRDAKNRKNLTR